jgi:hypothetical protein
MLAMYLELYYCSHLKAMLFSLWFGTQTCTIVCDPFVIFFRCNSMYVMCICLIMQSWL